MFIVFLVHRLPLSIGRSVGRPATRWTDGLRKVAGGRWMPSTGIVGALWRKPVGGNRLKNEELPFSILSVIEIR